MLQNVKTDHMNRPTDPMMINNSRKIATVIYLYATNGGAFDHYAV